jgi:hypothetical protein
MGGGGGGRGLFESGSTRVRKPGAAAVAVCRSGVTEMNGLAFRPVRPGPRVPWPIRWNFQIN